MRAATGARSIALMTSNPPPTLILELERADGELIAGRISTSTRAAIAFVGWLGLAGAIEAALRDGEPANDAEPTQGGGS